MDKQFDLIICGAGPAGLSAAIYAQRGGLKTLIIEKAFAGGQAALTYEVENYPGFKKTGGAELAMAMQEHAESLGAQFLYDEITAVNLTEKIKTVITVTQAQLQAKAVIIATGASPRILGVPGEAEFRGGRGVSYCATCDGAFFKGKTVAVVGGGNTAVEDALYLRRFSEKVYLIHRRQGFRASKILLERLAYSGITCILDSEVKTLSGEKFLERATIGNALTGETHIIDVSGIFVAIGQVPNTGLFKGQVALDGYGYVTAAEDTSASLPGVFAAGDVRTKSLRQIVTACADGAVAAERAGLYITENFII